MKTIYNRYSTMADYMRARNTALEMMEDRGYSGMKVADVEKTDLNVFMEMYDADAMDLVGTRGAGAGTSAEAGTHKLYVAFNKNQGGLDKANLERILAKVEETEPTADLVIVNTKYTKAIIKEVAKLQGRRIELFTLDDLSFNITRHVDLGHNTQDPRQTMFLLTEASEEWSDVPENKGKLGRIPITDPLAHYFGAKKGNVFKILEHSPTAGEIVKYFAVS